MVGGYIVLLPDKRLCNDVVNPQKALITALYVPRVEDIYSVPLISALHPRCVKLCLTIGLSLKINLCCVEVWTRERLRYKVSAVWHNYWDRKDALKKGFWGRIRSKKKAVQDGRRQQGIYRTFFCFRLMDWKKKRRWQLHSGAIDLFFCILFSLCRICCCCCCCLVWFNLLAKEGKPLRDKKKKARTAKKKDIPEFGPNQEGISVREVYRQSMNTSRSPNLCTICVHKSRKKFSNVSNIPCSVYEWKMVTGNETNSV